MYHLSDRFRKITMCVNALYDARQHGDLASAFSKVQEREPHPQQASHINERASNMSSHTRAIRYIYVITHPHLAVLGQPRSTMPPRTHLSTVSSALLFLFCLKRSVVQSWCALWENKMTFLTTCPRALAQWHIASIRSVHV